MEMKLCKEPLFAVAEALSRVMERLASVEATLAQLLEQKRIQDWYSTADVAKLLGKAEFTVREWCRFQRVHAQKRPCGRGLSQEWMVSHAELQRIRNEGLLPLPEY